MCASGCAFLSARVAARPFMPGIEMSMTTTSGFNSSACRTAAPPSSASATTFMSVSASISSFNPCRTVAWSSASRMRSGPVLSATIDHLARGHRERHPHENRGPFAGRRFDLNARSHQNGALLHADEPEPLADGGARCHLESHAVVLENQQDAIGSPLEDHFDAPGARVLGD